MGTISLQVPTVGQLNSTEDPKITSDFNTLQTVINGNIDDTNLLSPNNAVRRVLLQGGGLAADVTTGRGSPITWAVGDYICGAQALYGESVLIPGTGAGAVPLFFQDTGVQGQPTDFQVAGGKTLYGRVRGTITTNSVSSGATVAVGLYNVTSVASGFGAVGYGFSGVAGTQSSAGVLGTAGIQAFESPQFAMPSTGGSYAVGINITSSGPQLAADSAFLVSLQLLGYNA